jgi:hypothetical protein
MEAEAGRSSRSISYGVTNVTEETLFAAALEKGMPAERAAFLEEACAGDAALRRRVEALLASQEQAGFLRTPAVQRAAELLGDAESTRPAEARPSGRDELADPGDFPKEGPTSDRPLFLTEQPGTLIGRYKLLQLIGEGGMGTVFMAEQTHPVRRQVALKLINAGMDTRPVDALAVMASDGLDTTSVSLAIRVKSLAEEAADLRAQVNALRAAGVLNQGRANSLLVKLDLRDNNGDIGRMQAFLNEVGALIDGGVLSQAQADPLLGPGNVLLLGLRRR